MGIPIKTKAKYLGVPYNLTLKCEYTIQQFKPKMLYIFHRLFPILKRTDFRTRFNLWQIFVKPLYRMVFSLLSFPRSIRGQRGQRNIEQAMRISLKKFTLSPKQADNRVF